MCVPKVFYLIICTTLQMRGNSWPSIYDKKKLVIRIFIQSFITKKYEYMFKSLTYSREWSGDGGLFALLRRKTCLFWCLVSNNLSTSVYNSFHTYSNLKRKRRIFKTMYTSLYKMIMDWVKRLEKGKNLRAWGGLSSFHDHVYECNQ